MNPERRIPAELETLLLEAIEKTPDGIAIFSPDDILIYCNSTFASLFATTPEQAVGGSFETMMRHVYASDSGLQIDAKNFDSWLKKVIIKRRQESYRAFQSDTKDGRWFQVSEQQTDSGHIFAFAVDITAQKRAETKYRKLADKFQYHAETDALTEINNRRNFFRLADKELSRCQRLQKTAALLAIDIDYFKAVNDNYGHQVGDTVLKEVATRLTQQLRTYDLLGRIGGEEFAMLIPDVDPQTAATLADRVRRAVESQPFATPELSLFITLSIGVSLSDATVTELDPMISKADEALYAAKERGRNRVCFWPI